MEGARLNSPPSLPVYIRRAEVYPAGEIYRGVGEAGVGKGRPAGIDASGVGDAFANSGRGRPTRGQAAEEREKAESGADAAAGAAFVPSSGLLLRALCSRPFESPPLGYVPEGASLG